MTIPIASDHAGFATKERVKEILEELGHMPMDYGTDSDESVDYPDFAVQVAEKVNEGKYAHGILVCGSGQGMCMTANKYRSEEHTSELQSRGHLVCRLLLEKKKEQHICIIKDSDRDE